MRIGDRKIKHYNNWILVKMLDKYVETYYNFIMISQK